MKIRIVTVLKSLGSESLREESKTYAGGQRITRRVRDSSQVSKVNVTKILHKFSNRGLKFFAEIFQTL